MENVPENTVRDVIMDMLRTAFPRHQFPQLSHIVRTQWNNNEYARGSYTFYKTGSTGNDVKNLYEPIVYTFFFN